MGWVMGEVPDPSREMLPGVVLCSRCASKAFLVGKKGLNATGKMSRKISCLGSVIAEVLAQLAEELF